MTWETDTGRRVDRTNQRVLPVCSRCQSRKAMKLNLVVRSDRVPANLLSFPNSMRLSRYGGHEKEGFWEPTTMQAERKKKREKGVYDEAFRREAVALVESSPESLTELARRLGVSHWNL